MQSNTLFSSPCFMSPDVDHVQGTTKKIDDKNILTYINRGLSKRT